jgi:hypothetical protein
VKWAATRVGRPAPPCATRFRTFTSELEMRLPSVRSTFGILLLAVSLRPAPSEACTVFAVTNPSDGKVAIVAKSYDWDTQAAMVVQNPAGVTKRAVTFPGGDYKGSPPLPKAAWTWTSKLSSITFDQYGEDFPIAGMNEAGLVVEGAEMDPGTAYKSENFYVPAGATHVVSLNQWVQYVLDTFSTVQEVVAELKGPPPYALMPSTVPEHFLICDASGCVVAEIEKNALVLTQGQDLGVQPLGGAFIPVPAIANDFYDCSTKGTTARGLDYSLVDYEGFGGTRQPIPATPQYCVQDYAKGTATTATAGATTVTGSKTDWLSLWKKWGPAAGGGFTIMNDAIGTWHTVEDVTSPTQLTLAASEPPDAVAWSGAYTLHPSFPANSIQEKCDTACRTVGAWINSNSVQRFVRAAQNSVDLSANAPDVGAVFDALNKVYSDSVETGGTMWQIAYDIPGRRVHWRTIATGGSVTGFTGPTYSTSASAHVTCDKQGTQVANIDRATKCAKNDTRWTCNPIPDLGPCSATTCKMKPYSETWNRKLVAFTQSHSEVDLSGFSKLVTDVLPHVSADATKQIISNIWGGYPRGYTSCGGEITAEGVVNLFLSSALDPYLKHVANLVPSLEDDVKEGPVTISGLGSTTLTKLQVSKATTDDALRVEGNVPSLHVEFLSKDVVSMTVPIDWFGIKLERVRVSDDYDNLLCFVDEPKASLVGPPVFGTPTECAIGGFPVDTTFCEDQLRQPIEIVQAVAQVLAWAGTEFTTKAFRQCKATTMEPPGAGAGPDASTGGANAPAGSAALIAGGGGCSCRMGAGGAAASTAPALLVLALVMRRRSARHRRNRA